MSEVWYSSPPTVNVNETQCETNGVYVAGTNTITWESPYLSYFKVGSLSAITANLGTITAGSITSITISGTTFTGGLIQTATSGQRIVLNESSGNTARFYGDPGTGVTLAAEIGISTLSGSTSFIRAGTGAGSYIGIHGLSGSNSGLYGYSNTGFGVAARSVTGRAIDAVVLSSSSEPAILASATNGPGVEAASSVGVGGKFWRNGTSGNLSLVPGSSNPSSGSDGDITAVVGGGSYRLSVSFAGTWWEILSRNNGVGFNGNALQGKYTVNSAAVTNPDAIALVNQLRTALINCGICV